MTDTILNLIDDEDSDAVICPRCGAGMNPANELHVCPCCGYIADESEVY